MTGRALLFLLVLPFASSVNASQPVDMEKMSRLVSGSILHEYTRMDESGGAIRAEILMHTEVEQVWAILQGCGKAFVFVDGMEQCEILERTGQYTLIHQVVDTGLLAPRLDYRYESVNQAFSRMEFRLVEGNLRILQGNWEFEKVAEGLHVTYNMRVQPGFPLPRFLVRMSLRRMVPDMLACIRGLVNGSGTADKTRTDLSRCPGDI